jgi:hypothetical protein
MEAAAANAASGTPAIAGTEGAATCCAMATGEARKAADSAAMIKELRMKSPWLE